MTRIVAGLAGGRRLAVPAKGTRPTSERAREGLFNTLDARVGLDGSRVLDLYAGSGAVGLEALSRGARAAVMVECGVSALSVLRTNVTTLALPGARVVPSPVERFLADRPSSEPFEVVFADPPYATGDDELAHVLHLLGGPGWLAGGALIVVERSVRAAEPRWPAPMGPLSRRRYGEASLWYGRWP